MAVTRIRRVQDKGYRHKGWLHDPDSAPSSEKIIRPVHTPGRSNIKTNFRIFRPAVIPVFESGQEDSGRLPVRDFLNRLDDLYADRWPRRESPIRHDVSLTYFGSYVIQRAIRSSTDRLYRNFGTDRKQTRDIATKLKGSFMDFLRESRAIQVSMQDPFMPLGIESENLEYRQGRGQPILPGDEAYKWATAQVNIAPTPIMLPGKHAKYFALDVDQNEFLREEKEDIRDFFRTQHHMAIFGAEYLRC